MSNSFVFSPEQPRYIAASPQIRCYLNGGMGHGFYMEAYYRAQHSEFSHQRMYVHHHMVGSGTNFFDVRYNGSATMHSFGINIGAQCSSADEEHRLRLAHPRGRTRLRSGGFTANFDDVSHTVLEEAVRSELLSMTEQAVFTFDNKTDNNVKVSNLKYQSLSLQHGPFPRLPLLRRRAKRVKSVSLQGNLGGVLICSSLPPARQGVCGHSWSTLHPIYNSA